MTDRLKAGILGEVPDPGWFLTKLPEYRIFGGISETRRLGVDGTPPTLKNDLRQGGLGWERVIMMAPDVGGFFRWQEEMRMVSARILAEAELIDGDGWRITEVTVGGLRAITENYLFNYWEPDTEDETRLRDRVRHYRNQWLAGALVEVTNSEGWLVRSWRGAEVVGNNGRATVDLARMVERIGVLGVVSRIAELEKPDEVLVMFKSMGIFAPNFSWEEYGERLEFDVSNMYRIRKKAMSRMTGMVGVEMVESHEAMSVILQTITRCLGEIEGVQTEKQHFTGYNQRSRVVFRLGEMEVDERWKVEKMLTPEERERLSQLLARDESGKLFTMSDLCKKYGNSMWLYLRTLETVNLAIEGKLERYIGTDGQVMVEWSQHAKLLKLIEGARDCMGLVSTRMSTMQVEVLGYLIQPNERGEYPTLDDLPTKFGDRSVNWPVYVRRLGGDLKKILAEEGVKVNWRNGSRVK